MAVNSIGTGNNYVSLVQPQPQSATERVSEQKNDKDKDDAAKAAAAAAANTSTQPPLQPTVNTNGQQVGSIVNTKA